MAAPEDEPRPRVEVYRPGERGPIALLPPDAPVPTVGDVLLLGPDAKTLTGFQPFVVTRRVYMFARDREDGLERFCKAWVHVRTLTDDEYSDERSFGP
jgi:hypothetical protein